MRKKAKAAPSILQVTPGPVTFRTSIPPGTWESPGSVPGSSETTVTPEMIESGLTIVGIYLARPAEVGCFGPEMVRKIFVAMTLARRRRID